MQPARPAPERMAVSLNEAASLLGIGRTLVYDLARSGELPTVRIGARRRVPVAAIKRLLETATAEPVAG